MTANIRPDLVRAQARVNAAGAFLASFGCSSVQHFAPGVYQIEIPQLPPAALLDVMPIGPSALVASIDVIGPTTVEVRITSSGGGGTASEDRRDFSVNGALVEDFDGAAPILRTSTQRNPAGAYVGGGVGNKAILGWGGKLVPLNAFLAMDWSVYDLSPEATPAVWREWPYVNLVVELDPQVIFPPAYSILAFGPTFGVPLNTCTEIVNGRQRSVSWDVNLHNVMVVNDRGMYEIAPFLLPPGGWPAGLPGAGYIPAALGPGSGNPPVGSWLVRSYALADILAAWPNAKIVAALPGDGGLPAATPVTGFLFVLGDSGWLEISVKRLDLWTYTNPTGLQDLLGGGGGGGGGTPTDAGFSLTVTVA